MSEISAQKKGNHYNKKKGQQTETPKEEEHQKHFGQKASFVSEEAQAVKGWAAPVKFQENAQKIEKQVAAPQNIENAKPQIQEPEKQKEEKESNQPAAFHKKATYVSEEAQKLQGWGAPVKYSEKKPEEKPKITKQSKQKKDPKPQGKVEKEEPKPEEKKEEPTKFVAKKASYVSPEAPTITGWGQVQSAPVEEKPAESQKLSGKKSPRQNKKAKKEKEVEKKPETLVVEEVKPEEKKEEAPKIVAKKASYVSPEAPNITGWGQPQSPPTEEPKKAVKKNKKVKKAKKTENKANPEAKVEAAAETPAAALAATEGQNQKVYTKKASYVAPNAPVISGWVPKKYQEQTQHNQQAERPAKSTEEEENLEKQKEEEEQTNGKAEKPTKKFGKGAWVAPEAEKITGWGELKSPAEKKEKTEKAKKPKKENKSKKEAPKEADAAPAKTEEKHGFVSKKANFVSPDAPEVTKWGDRPISHKTEADEAPVKPAKTQKPKNNKKEKKVKAENDQNPAESKETTAKKAEDKHFAPKKAAFVAAEAESIKGWAPQPPAQAKQPITTEAPIVKEAEKSKHMGKGTWASPEAPVIKGWGTN